MIFGNVPEEDLGSIDFTLPPDPPMNSGVLSGRRVPSPKLYIGCSSWGHKSWVGKVYPPKTPATKFRELYPLHFNATELNATHYATYPPEVIAKWAEPARGRDFKFCPKWPQSVSHYSSFIKVEGLTDAFINSISAFGENLGPTFLQVSDLFSPKKKDPLFEYLATLPTDLDLFVEFRHPDWFIEAETLFPVIKSLGRGLVITDTPGRRDCIHMYLTMPKLFLRFVCNSDHPTTYSRITEWAKRISVWMDQGLEEAYIFLHPGDEEVIPDLTMAWVDAVNLHCGLKLTSHYLKQHTLF
jgi:uncharacterized protein YecE (DUF72 family)